MNIEKLLFAYKYAVKISRKFQSPRYLKEDMVQDFILFVIENPKYLEEIVYLKSFVYRNLKWNRSNFVKRLENRKCFNYVDKPIEHLESESNYLDLNDFGQITSLEDFTEISIINEFMRHKITEQSAKVFELSMLGYSPNQIGSLSNMTRGSVNCSVKRTRKKVREYFKNN